MNEVMELLEKFQHGYSERNLSKAEEFIQEVFVKDEPVYYGPSPAEQCVGAGRIMRLIGYDWTVWGDLKLDFDSLVCHEYGDAADFVMTGCVDWVIDKDTFLNRAMMDVKDLVLRGGNPEQLLNTLSDLSSKMLMEAGRGEEHILPIRLSGMAVREDGKMRISHLHLSYPTQNYPDCRIYRDSV